MIIMLFSIVCWRSLYLCLSRWWRSRPIVSELNILRTKVWSPSSDFTFSVMTSVAVGGGGCSGLGEVQRANQQQWSLIKPSLVVTAWTPGDVPYLSLVVCRAAVSMRVTALLLLPPPLLIKPCWVRVLRRIIIIIIVYHTGVICIELKRDKEIKHIK